MAGGGPTDPVERLGSTRVVPKELLHVGPGNAPSHPGTGDTGRIHPVLGQQPSHHGTQQKASTPAFTGSHRGDNRLTGRHRLHPIGFVCGNDITRAEGVTVLHARGHGGRGGASGRDPGSCRINATENGPDRNNGPLAGDYLNQHPTHRRRHFGVDLLSGHLVQRLVDDHRFANTDEPARDRPFDDSLAQLRHKDVSHRNRYPCRARPVSDSTVSPNNSLSVGWGWMNAATSSTVASQLTAR